MKINYLGHSCFKIEFSDNLSVITDPYTGIGYEMSAASADILTCSHQHYDHNFIQRVKSNKLYTEHGNYIFENEDKSLKIIGIDSFHDEKSGALRGNNVIFVYEYGDLRVCHMGDIGEQYSLKLAKKIGDIDVLLIPVGGTYTVDASGATEWINKIMPKIVVPMHYFQKSCSIDIYGVDRFLKLNKEKEIIKTGCVVEINKTMFTQDKIKIIVMERG